MKQKLDFTIIPPLDWAKASSFNEALKTTTGIFKVCFFQLDRSNAQAKPGFSFVSNPVETR
ncbi:MAG: hypothetical protein WD426_16385 [Anditalea sp.]